MKKKNIYIILNKVDELHEEPKAIQNILNYFEKIEFPIFAISAKFHKKIPAPEFINFIKEIKNNSADIWIREEIIKRIPSITPYNLYLEKLPSCSWENIENFPIRNCIRVNKFVKNICERCKKIEKQNDLLTNINFENIYAVCNKNLHRSQIKYLIESHSDNNGSGYRCIPIKFCLINLKDLVVEDYGVIEINDIYYFIIFSTLPQIKLFKYYIIDINKKIVEEFCNNIELGAINHY